MYLFPCTCGVGALSYFSSFFSFSFSLALFFLSLSLSLSRLLFFFFFSLALFFLFLARSHLFILSLLRCKLACAKRQNVERILWIMNWIALMKDRKILFVFHAVAYFYHFNGNAHTIQTTTRCYSFFVCVSLLYLACATITIYHLYSRFHIRQYETWTINGNLSRWYRHTAKFSSCLEYITKWDIYYKKLTHSAATKSFAHFQKDVSNGLEIFDEKYHQFSFIAYIIFFFVAIITFSNGQSFHRIAWFYARVNVWNWMFY